ncbi:MAG: hypothetical protein NW217_13300 [Hyphomicrobiaceae bacterium]|nr:hypothetical protein [Hyphomicrobiaceae bacterium]
MTTPEHKLNADMKPVTGGCCAAHGTDDLDVTRAEAASPSKHIEHAMVSAADAPADKPKARHGSGCCCS